MESGPLIVERSLKDVLCLVPDNQDTLINKDNGYLEIKTPGREGD